MFASIAPNLDEVMGARPGDDSVTPQDVVMNRGFTVHAPAAEVWPWLVQLGKGRAGWYLPTAVERFLPRKRRAVRRLDDRWQQLEVGTVIPDYGGADATFEVVEIAPPSTLVYSSQRGAMTISWSITLSTPAPGATRVHLRLILGPVRRKWLATTVGELFDALTILGMAAGLRERVAARPRR